MGTLNRQNPVFEPLPLCKYVHGKRRGYMIGLFFVGIVVGVIAMAVLLYVRKYDA